MADKRKKSKPRSEKLSMIFSDSRHTHFRIDLFTGMIRRSMTRRGGTRVGRNKGDVVADGCSERQEPAVGTIFTSSTVCMPMFRVGRGTLSGVMHLDLFVLCFASSVSGTFVSVAT